MSYDKCVYTKIYVQQIIGDGAVSIHTRYNGWTQTSQDWSTYVSKLWLGATIYQSVQKIHMHFDSGVALLNHFSVFLKKLVARSVALSPKYIVFMIKEMKVMTGFGMRCCVFKWG